MNRGEMLSSEELQMLLEPLQRPMTLVQHAQERRFRWRIWALFVLAVVALSYALVPEGGFGGRAYPIVPAAHQFTLFADIHVLVLTLFLPFYVAAYLKDWRLQELSWLALGLSFGVIALDAAAAWLFMRPLHAPILALWLGVLIFAILMARNAWFARYLKPGPRHLFVISAAV